MPRMKTEKLAVWGAVNDEDGKVLVSSISAYRSVALRWASRYRNHHVEQLCNVSRNHLAESEGEAISMAKTGKNGHDVIPAPRRRVARKA